ncbi:cytosolic regulator of adenylyl cyclase [Heterostelium album PN500]|uniref:Cytosolic regulator of adenylyl cyclase n=1 Tax=Heterostelium pallidum (strain ATCC 26659 / Pp 5 / PN500) TaxID=670386 RepID=D3BEE2_HETP5|nr:cytosolic regulator of adenylyl cyclase [Heterostelium album PN500]EFA80273.1 cytosolic regulator of adenylyl cyclase [Heterostelium album PN500]|eukprot:XP_020432393.1 cytosolic regulator of adenylyl cyclase [Heterostelium album PN500]
MYYNIILSCLMSKWLTFGRIKNDSSYSILMKKTGGNGKGFLDRYFILHRNYIAYYKPGKMDGRPDDTQEPQGYINLGECILEETKSLFKTQPLTFQIASKNGRNYIIRGKDERSIEQFLLLIRPRIQSLTTMTIASLGNVDQSLNTIMNLLPRPMKLPDRVKPDVSTKWIVEMTEYYNAYWTWEPYLMKVEQFSELCYGGIKSYVDWFVSSDGPRLSMIRCEELVLDNWIDYIKKTALEITTYQDSRFFREDFDDITKHIRNMVILVDSYNLYMHKVHHSVKHVDKFLEEKQLFEQHLDIFSKMPSRHSINFNNIDGLPGKIYPAENSESNNNDDDEICWSFVRNTLIHCDSSDSLSDSKLGSSGEIDEWRFSEGCFQHKHYGSVVWNNKSWIWTHPKTDYRIKFDWDNINQSFVYFQPVITSITISSTNSTPNKLSITKKPHPDTVYADWKYSSNALTAVVVGNKAEPKIRSFQIQGNVPVPAVLIAAMFSHIRNSLQQLGIIASGGN